MLSDKKECYICKKKYDLEVHHIFFGKDRHKSEEMDWKVWLCSEHHRGTIGVHGKNGKTINLLLKARMQEEFEKEHSHEEFMNIIHKNYIF